MKRLADRFITSQAPSPPGEKDYNGCCELYAGVVLDQPIGVWIIPSSHEPVIIP